MKILRKRVGSLKIRDEDKSNVKIINDSILLNQEILFNYLPIKNLSFFLLNLEKSNIDIKYWIFLDLNLDLLYKDLNNGKIIINRDLIFDMINSSINRLKINSLPKIKFNNFNSVKSILSYDDFKLDNIFCFDYNFVKYGKIYFDINRKLLTVDKCKKKRVKIPSVFLIKDFNLIIPSIQNLSSDPDNENSLFIISNKDSDLINSNFFNIKKYNNSKYMFLYSEDLNFQMNNYFSDIDNSNFIEQLKFESNNFFYSKKNIFILANNLNEFSIKYLSFCNFERLFILDNYLDKELEIFMPKLLTKYEQLRISKNNFQNNLLVSNYILINRIFRINIKNDIKFKKLQIHDFPLIQWNKNTNLHFLNLLNNNKIITKFIQIGINNEWSTTYIDKLKKEIEPSNNKCPISLSELNSFSITTGCFHNFNLINLLKWLEENNECPICRTKINLQDLKFINTPDFKSLINFLNNNKIIVIVDQLWHDLLKNEKINVIIQSDFINNFKPKNKETKLLNLSGLSNNDIFDIYNEANFSKHSFYIIELIE